MNVELDVQIRRAAHVMREKGGDLHIMETHAQKPSFDGAEDDGPMRTAVRWFGLPKYANFSTRGPGFCVQGHGSSTTFQPVGPKVRGGKLGRIRNEGGHVDGLTAGSTPFGVNTSPKLSRSPTSVERGWRWGQAARSDLRHRASHHAIRQVPRPPCLSTESRHPCYTHSPLRIVVGTLVPCT